MDFFWSKTYTSVGEVTVGSMDGASVGSYVGFGTGAFVSGCVDGFALLVLVLVGVLEGLIVGF